MQLGTPLIVICPCEACKPAAITNMALCLNWFKLCSIF